ncbi:MAG TPA: nuclear transport factor 2 family protein [Pyrinomonadaceae bacterium]|jgi:hypothetical protein|nr:nuclear transport factor 2 family protein [Pyrinomonadaceae bacterium]
MRKAVFVLLALLIACTAEVRAQSTSGSEADRAAIKQTALDYIEGWYEGDAERMERALHPELAKRIVRTNQQGQSRLDQMSAMSLVQGTRRAYGKQTPKEKQQKDVTILDVFENAACAKVIASDWVDYLQLARWNGHWVIVNVLWELKPTTTK